MALCVHSPGRCSRGKLLDSTDPAPLFRARVSRCRSVWNSLCQKFSHLKDPLDLAFVFLNGLLYVTCQWPFTISRLSAFHFLQVCSQLLPNLERQQGPAVISKVSDATTPRTALQREYQVAVAELSGLAFRMIWPAGWQGHVYLLCATLNPFRRIVGKRDCFVSLCVPL